MPAAAAPDIAPLGPRQPLWGALPFAVARLAGVVAPPFHVV